MNFSNIGLSTLLTGIGPSATAFSFPSGQGTRFTSDMRIIIWNKTLFTDPLSALIAHQGEIAHIVTLVGDHVTLVTRGLEGTTPLDFSDNTQQYGVCNAITAGVLDALIYYLKVQGVPRTVIVDESLAGLPPPAFTSAASAITFVNGEIPVPDVAHPFEIISKSKLDGTPIDWSAYNLQTLRLSGIFVRVINENVYSFVNDWQSILAGNYDEQINSIGLDEQTCPLSLNFN